MPCDTPEWAAGGWPGGKDGSIHKGPLKDCRLGTRLALVLLPFHGMAGGGCCLVLTEWRDYFRRIGERRFIITMLYFLQSVDGHYVHFCTYTTILCDLPLHLVHTAYNRLLCFQHHRNIIKYMAQNDSHGNMITYFFTLPWVKVITVLTQANTVI